mgnify:CR=1 FL=1
MAVEIKDGKKILVTPVSAEDLKAVSYTHLTLPTIA